MRQVELTDDQADKVLLEMSRRGFGMPFMARVANYPNPDDLRAADIEADAANRDALREAMTAAQL